MTQVITNRDPYRRGRVFTWVGWLYPLVRREGLFKIPEPGDFVEVEGDFYVIG